MKDTVLCYSVGALLYCPANNETIVDSLVSNKFDAPFSLALCLEDTIRDDRVAQAEAMVVRSLKKLKEEENTKQFYMPKLFIRVREPQQIERLNKSLEESASLVTGYIIPKFSLENADDYINQIIRLNESSCKTTYMMPIFESPSMIDLRHRYDILYGLKIKLLKVSDLVLNIRVGGNDLCHAFGFRRHMNESIHDIKPVYHILSDIMTVFGMDYVVSGPVWEYYSKEGWDTGLSRELAQDRLNGFVGKTVIHPNQISLVNEACKVSRADYEDASSILNWDKDIAGLVTGSLASGRMNEYKTHSNWAKKTLILSHIYGIRD